MPSSPHGSSPDSSPATIFTRVASTIVLTDACATAVLASGALTIVLTYTNTTAVLAFISTPLMLALQHFPIPEHHFPPLALVEGVGRAVLGLSGQHLVLHNSVL